METMTLNLFPMLIRFLRLFRYRGDLRGDMLRFFKLFFGVALLIAIVSSALFLLQMAVQALT